MTAYDVLMVLVVVAGMVWGAWRGITWQLASIASLVLGYSVAHPLSGQLAPQFPGPPIVARALAMLAVYAAVSGAIFLAAWAVRTTLRQLKFEAYDRHLGMILGGLEGSLLGVIGTLFVVSLAPQTRGPIFDSPTGRIVGQVMDAVGPVLPGEVRNELAPFWSGRGAALAADPAPAAAPETKNATDRVENNGSGSVRGLIEDGEKRIGKAVVEAAENELERTGAANDRAVERR